MKQLIVLSTLVVSFFPFLNFTQQNPTSKTFKAAYIASADAPVAYEKGLVNYYRIPCPNNPVAYGCAETGSIPCGFSKVCPVQSPFKQVPCPNEQGTTHCAMVSTGGTVCPNPTECFDGLSYHICPLDPGISMCAYGGAGVPCSTPSTCPPIPPLAPATEEIKF